MALRVDTYHLEPLHCLAIVTHAACHACALPHTARVSACTNGAGRTFTVRLTVGTWTTSKTMALNHTSEATPLRPTCYVNQIPSVEQIDIDNLTGRVLADIIRRHLTHITDGNTSLLHLAQHRLGKLA